MKEEVIKLNLEGKTNTEIRSITGHSLTTISKYLKESGLFTRRASKEKSLDSIKLLLDEGKTNFEIASILNISPTTVRKYTRTYLNIDTNSVKQKPIINKKLELTDIQLEVLYGSLLGDMSISKHANFARFSISQGGKQESYFDHKCEIFKDVIGKPCKKQRFDKRTNKYYNKYQVRSLSHKKFLEIYNRLYINNVKTITLDYLNLLTPRSLAYWFMDDGNNKGVLATNCFSISECKLIQSWLLNTYDIETTFHLQKQQPILYFTKRGKKNFYKLTYEFFIPDMLYKIENWIP